MTNVAKLFTEFPDTPSLLKSLQLMCGRFTDSRENAPHAEWNAHCDPAAAGIVYSTSAPNHTSLGLDVTLQVNMDSSEVRKHFQHPLLKPVLQMSDVWFNERPRLNFHDPLAAVSLFDESVCGFENGTATVKRFDGLDDGFTEWVPDANGQHRVGKTVDATRFFDSYFSVFT
jgi:purine nucleosidase